MSPMTTPPTELRMRVNHDVCVVSVKVLLMCQNPENEAGTRPARPENPASTRFWYQTFLTQDAIAVPACIPRLSQARHKRQAAHHVAVKT